MNRSPTTAVDSLALFNVLRVLATGTLFDVDALKKSAQDPTSDLAKLVAANNIAVQLNVESEVRPDDLAATLAHKNADLRRLLGEVTCEGTPYTDFGEFKCQNVIPYIDYMRDSVDTMREKLAVRRVRNMQDMVPVNRVALTTVVDAFRDKSTVRIVKEWSGMGLGHSAAAQLGRDLDKAMREKTTT